MYKFLTKNGQTLAFGLGVLVTVIFLITVVSNMGEFSVMEKEQQVQTSIFDTGLYGAIVFTIIAALAMLIFGVIQVASDFKGSIKGILGFAALLIIFLVAYYTTDPEPSAYIQGAINKFEQGGAVFTDNNMRFISGGITTTLILIVVAAIAFIVSEVSNFFK